MKKTMKWYAVISLTLALCMMAGAASACTTIYAGSEATLDGTTIFGRSEDFGNSSNKLMYVSPAGKHTAGEVYNGCYGFTWTFTHDSYSYTAFSDDNGEGVGGECPDCGQTHEHTPYEAGGTNEMGVTVTATETIGGAETSEEADPYEDLGIEEAEIVTVLLGEAATAKEALTVLTGIYDTAGACDGAGLIVADKDETWYIENVTGHQYIAVKLSDDMVMVQPNMAIIGLIDLDDTENVVASAGLIETAQAAGTFVGDAEANVIDYVASYCGETQANARMVNALAYLDPAYSDTEAEIDPAAYLITNVGEGGEIVAMQTGIHPDHKLSIAEVQDFYHIPNIGYVRNLETHIFQLDGQEGATSTVEWVTMNDAAINVFVPYYPMLTTDVYAPYKLSTVNAEFTQEEPESGLYYPTTVYQRVNGERVAVEGFMVLPDVWAESMYWTYDALSNMVMYCGLDEAVVNNVYQTLYDKQAQVNASFEEFKATLASAEDPAQAATQWSMAAAQDTHETAIGLVNEILK